MLIEFLVAAAALLPAPAPPPLLSDEPPKRAIPRLRRGPAELPNGGRACLIISRCDPRPCILPAQRIAPLSPTRCGLRHRRPTPRVVPATG